MVGIVVLALMVSFVIARYEFKFNKLYSLFAAGMMFIAGHHPVVSAAAQSALDQLRIWALFCPR